MRKLAIIAIWLLSVVNAFAVASYADKAILSSDTTFQNRVREVIAANCISIANEGFAVVNHKKRADFCVLILFTPDSYKTLFAITMATDTSVIADATQAGTVVLTAGNVATQAALVTDGHLDTAFSSQLNSYLQLP